MRNQWSTSFSILFVASTIFVSQLVYSAKLDFPEISKPADEFRNREFLGISSDSEMSIEEDQRVYNFLHELPKRVLLFLDGCSAVFVSNTGYALTALHCLNWGFEAVEKRRIKTKTGLNLSYYVSRKNLLGTVYSAGNLLFSPFSGRVSRRIDPVEVGGVELIHMGKGYAYPEGHWNSSVINDPAIQKVGSFSDDYALIKFTNMPPGYICSRISTELPNESDLVRAAGHPLGAEKREEKSPELLLEHLRYHDYRTDETDLRVEEYARLILNLYRSVTDWRDKALNYEKARFPLYLSVGRYFESVSSTMSAFPSTYADIGYLESVYKPEKFFYSTVMMGNGMSGGPTFNEKDEVIGLNTAMFKNLARVFPTGLSPGAVHISVPYIYNTLLNQYGRKFVNQVFNCP